ncbi:MAG: TonB-dependent receptor, partial [Spirochaetia bacterium]|nr:TonB-dependent receptor [Spirochaetia bacterium]
GYFFSGDKRVNDYGTNDLYRSGMLHPEWILLDILMMKQLSGLKLEINDLDEDVYEAFKRYLNRLVFFSYTDREAYFSREPETFSPAMQAAVSAQAAEEEQEPETISIYSSYSGFEAERHPHQVSQLPGGEIRSADAEGLRDDVELIPGLELFSLGGVLQPAAMTARGTSSGNTFAGIQSASSPVPLYSDDPGLLMKSIPAAGIRRVEVYRGPALDTMQPSGLGGLVNILLDDSPDEAFGLTAGYRYGGSFNTDIFDWGNFDWDSFGWGNHSHSVSLDTEASWDFSTGSEEANPGREVRISGMDLSAGFQGVFSDGKFPYDPPGSDTRKRRNNAGGIAGGGYLSMNWDLNALEGERLNALFTLHGNDTEIPESLISSASPPTDQAESLGSGFQGKLEYLRTETPLGTLIGGLSGLWEHQEIRDPDAGPAVDDSYTERSLHWHGGILNRNDDFGFVRTGLDLTYSGGADFYDWQHDSDEDASRWTHNLNAGLAVGIAPYNSTFKETESSRLELFPSLKLSWTDITSSEGPYEKAFFSPGWNVGGILPLQADRSLVLKGSIGTAYRSPSIQDLFGAETSFLSGGDSALEPEKSFGGDAGFTLKDLPGLSGLEWYAGYFGKQIEDYIFWDTVDPGLITDNSVWNLGTVLIHGAETAISYTFPIWPALKTRLVFQGSYTFMHTRMEDESDNQLPYHPEHQGDAVLRLEHEGGHKLLMKGSYTGERWTDKNNSTKLDNYYLLNLEADVQITPAWTFAGSVRNVFDASYKDISGYPKPGRTFTAALEYAYGGK